MPACSRRPKSRKAARLLTFSSCGCETVSRAEQGPPALWQKKPQRNVLAHVHPLAPFILPAQPRPKRPTESVLGARPHPTVGRLDTRRPSGARSRVFLRLAPTAAHITPGAATSIRFSFSLAPSPSPRRTLTKVSFLPPADEAAASPVLGPRFAPSHVLVPCLYSISPDLTPRSMCSFVFFLQGGELSHRLQP